MKKFMIGLVCAFLLAGCSLPWGGSETTGPDTEMPMGQENSEKNEAEIDAVAPEEMGQPAFEGEISVDGFFIDYGENGLILSHEANEEFQQVLSTNPILSAEIDDGILRFTEVTENMEEIKMVNLQAFVEFLNQE